MNPCSTGRFYVFVLGAALLGPPSIAAAQETAAPAPVSERRLGLDLFGGAGLSWPSAQDSFEAVGLRSKAFEAGGGARVTGLWRTLFAQVSAARWSDTGERAFVAEDGSSFPLGIPLEVSATFVDATVGVKNVARNPAGRISFQSYVGAGVGVVRYKESSPFAEPGDDLDENKPSYHVVAGAEVPLTGPLALAIDGRYRFVPGILGDEGASAALDEDFLGGFQLSVGLRLGFGGPRAIVAPPVLTRPLDSADNRPPPAAPVRDRIAGALISEPAPVFLLPDATRTPLRTLAAGTTVRILQEQGDWLRIEFNDSQFGRRVAYVQRRFVQTR